MISVEKIIHDKHILPLSNALCVFTKNDGKSNLMGVLIWEVDDAGDVSFFIIERGSTIKNPVKDFSFFQYILTPKGEKILELTIDQIQYVQNKKMQTT